MRKYILPGFIPSGIFQTYKPSKVVRASSKPSEVTLTASINWLGILLLMTRLQLLERMEQFDCGIVVPNAPPLHNSKAKISMLLGLQMDIQLQLGTKMILYDAWCLFWLFLLRLPGWMFARTWRPFNPSNSALKSMSFLGSLSVILCFLPQGTVEFLSIGALTTSLPFTTKLVLRFLYFLN